ncbi:MAG: PAS domain-containing protein [Gammaproteobacteria bacterium]|nr:PAS domain-containing protein [Gammaproteobacteria bacterium]
MNRLRASVAAAAGLLLLLMVVGALLINGYIGAEKERDLLQWETRLGLVAGTKADAVARLLTADHRNLEELAANASLRFYLWQAANHRPAAGDATDAEPESQGYLRNLLLAAAARWGYEADSGARIPANLPQPRSTGLAILDAQLRPVVATPGLFDLTSTYAEVLRPLLDGQIARIVQLMNGAGDEPVLVEALPIATVSGAGGDAARPLGVLLAIRSAAADLYPLLARGPDFSEESESILLERRGEEVVLLSPTHDGSKPLRRALPAGRGELAEVAAVAAPGRFVALPNYRGEKVLQVSRPISGQGWVLVQQVDAAQALSLADERRRFLLMALSLLLLSVAAVAVAAWRHGSGVRARHLAAELGSKADHLQQQTELLHTISDSLDVPVILVAADNRVVFTNQAAAAAAGTTISTMQGGLVSGVLPQAVQPGIHAGLAQVRDQGGSVQQLLAWPDAEGETERMFRASFIPVHRIGEERDLVLLVLSDVSAIQQANQRNTDMLRRLVLTLVGVVDRHDPYSAHHAQRMTEVADALARELDFSDRERATLTLAASLANIGKVMIPVDLLTKPGPLSAEEQATLQKHVGYGLELLHGLQFDGPVVDIIAQKHERPDGRGYPHGLPASRITLAGQVLAVANAFVALLSPRAWRQGLSVQGALDELMRGAGSQFDRRVVAALFHVAENRQDWSQWQ